MREAGTFERVRRDPLVGETFPSPLMLLQGKLQKTIQHFRCVITYCKKDVTNSVETVVLDIIGGLFVFSTICDKTTSMIVRGPNTRECPMETMKETSWFRL